MLEAIATFFVFQLIGEVIARACDVPLPGPVIGMLLLLALLVLRPRFVEKIEPTATSLLERLSLLFVPAGVGVMQHFDILHAQWLPILAAILVSTAATIVVTSIVMTLVERALPARR